MFLTTGAPWAAHKFDIKKSLTDPEFKPSKIENPRYNDDMDVEDEELTLPSDDWQQEILKDLGR